MNKKMLPLVLATLLCSASASAATLTFNTGPDSQAAGIVYLTDNILRVNHEDNNWILFDRSLNTLFIVEDDQQRFYAIDEAQIQSFGQTLGSVNQQIEQALSELPESQRAQARALMESMMPGGGRSSAAVEEVIDINFTGRFDSVADVRCEIVETRVAGQQESELCIADPDALKLSSGEIATMNAMARFAENMLDTMKENAGSLFPDNIASGSMVKALQNGVPVRVIDKNNNDRSELNSISHEPISDDLTKIPSQYRRESFGPGF